MTHGVEPLDAVIEFGVGGEGGAAHEAPLDDGADRLVAHDDVRAGRAGVIAQQLVSSTSRRSTTPWAGRSTCSGQGSMTSRPAGDHPHALDRRCPSSCECVDVEQAQLTERPRRQHVAARLVARHGTLLDHRDVVARWANQ